MPKLSVIVPCHDRLALAEPVLRGLVSQLEENRAELLVVDDGSQPPVASRLTALGDLPGLRVIRHDRCRGCGAARNSGVDTASGEILLFCDSDIQPAPGMLAEHLAFHRAHPEPEASHLGQLAWGSDPGLFARLVGPRGNPRLTQRIGRVRWTEWFMDNWSVKRQLLDAGPHRFDPGFEGWGWEDLELGWRLERAGATSTQTGRATGLNLKPIEIETLRQNFTSSVPNLLRLAARVEDSQARDWLGLGMADPRALAACESTLEDAWSRCLELEAGSGDLVEAAGPLSHPLARALSDAVFRLGIARGLAEEADARELSRLGAGPPADAARAADMGALLAVVAAVGDRIDTQGPARLGRQILGLERALPGLKHRLTARVRTERRRLRKRADATRTMAAGGERRAALRGAQTEPDRR